MGGERNNTPLNITFHNPNTSEELSKFLIKLAAQSVVEYTGRDRTDAHNRTLQQ